MKKTTLIKAFTKINKTVIEIAHINANIFLNLKFKSLRKQYEQYNFCIQV